ncbi:hypothetical protein SynPROSU1_00663 [Synechococcus sp. PROS-U-1]|nr:hypothetical protein SynPROSU1_00663 [Synechococcus sp. PROS-U-1]
MLSFSPNSSSLGHHADRLKAFKSEPNGVNLVENLVLLQR